MSSQQTNEESRIESATQTDTTESDTNQGSIISNQVSNNNNIVKNHMNRLILKLIQGDKTGNVTEKLDEELLQEHSDDIITILQDSFGYTKTLHFTFEGPQDFQVYEPTETNKYSIILFYRGINKNMFWVSPNKENTTNIISDFITFLETDYSNPVKKIKCNKYKYNF